MPCNCRQLRQEVKTSIKSGDARKIVTATSRAGVALVKNTAAVVAARFGKRR